MRIREDPERERAKGKRREGLMRGVLILIFFKKNLPKELLPASFSTSGQIGSDSDHRLIFFADWVHRSKSVKNIQDFFSTPIGLQRVENSHYRALVGG